MSALRICFWLLYASLLKLHLKHQIQSHLGSEFRAEIGGGSVAGFSAEKLILQITYGWQLSDECHPRINTDWDYHIHWCCLGRGWSHLWNRISGSLITWLNREFTSRYVMLISELSSWRKSLRAVANLVMLWVKLLRKSERWLVRVPGSPKSGKLTTTIFLAPTAEIDFTAITKLLIGARVSSTTKVIIGTSPDDIESVRVGGQVVALKLLICASNPGGVPLKSPVVEPPKAISVWIGG